MDEGLQRKNLFELKGDTGMFYMRQAFHVSQGDPGLHSYFVTSTSICPSIQLSIIFRFLVLLWSTGTFVQVVDRGLHSLPIARVAFSLQPLFSGYLCISPSFESWLGT